MDIWAVISGQLSFSGAVVAISFFIYRMVAAEQKFSRFNVRWAIMFLGPVDVALAVAWIVVTFAGNT